MVPFGCASRTKDLDTAGLGSIPPAGLAQLPKGCRKGRSANFAVVGLRLLISKGTQPSSHTQPIFPSAYMVVTEKTYAFVSMGELEAFTNPHAQRFLSCVKLDPWLFPYLA